MSQIPNSRRTRLPHLWVGLALGVLTLLAAGTDWDLWVQGLFYDPELGWRLAHHPVIRFLYLYGTWPALIAGFGGLLFAAVSRWVPSWRRGAPLALFLAGVLALGPGLLINGILKESFGRPRPRSVEAFGGVRDFHRLGKIPPEPLGKSFPSGHASMGFFWLALAVYGRRYGARGLTVWGLGAGCLHGGAMAFGRIAQGGHFFSDVMWAAGIVYISASALVAWTPNPSNAPDRPQDNQSPRPKHDH